MGNIERQKKAKRAGRLSEVMQKSDAPKAKAVLRRNRDSSQATPDTATKADQILSMLKQPGATLKQIMEVTGWQAHSVRGFISGHVVKKMGLRVKSFRLDGERVYEIKR